MCTRTLWLHSGQGVIAGRNMDWAQSLGTNLWVLPAGAKREGIEKDPNPLAWQSKYASLVATAYDLATVDGLNERGLAAHVLWLAESDYGVRDTSQAGLSISLWAQYQGFGGQLPLPGTTEAAGRFVRASYYLEKLPAADSPQRAYAALLSVMRNAAQPFGVADPARPHISMTIWRRLIDLEKRLYAFESSFSPDIVWVSLDRMDPAKCQKLDLSREGLVGDVGKLFVETPPFTFMSA